MTAPHYRIEVRDIADAEACVRRMHREARGLASRYATMTACHFGLAAGGSQYEAQLDVHLPQHQVIVNATAPTIERAVRDAVAKAASELVRLEARDPSAARATQVKAA